MSVRLRRVMLALHLVVSVGWIGAVLAYIGLGISAVTSRDESTIRGSWVAMETIGWAVLVPLAVATLVTGVVMSLGTRWGLFRYYWVMLSFTLTTLASLVLVLHMPDVSSLAQRAQTAGSAELQSLGGDLFHATLGLLVLTAVLVLNVFKPPGMTRYGWRRRPQPGSRPVTTVNTTPASSRYRNN